jgi:hypothetical protein
MQMTGLTMASLSISEYQSALRQLISAHFQDKGKLVDRGDVQRLFHQIFFWLERLSKVLSLCLWLQSDFWFRVSALNTAVHFGLLCGIANSLLTPKCERFSHHLQTFLLA